MCRAEFDEAERAVERDSSGHACNGVEPHGAITGATTRVDDRNREGAADATALEFREHVKAFISHIPALSRRSATMPATCLPSRASSSAPWGGA